MFVVLLRFTRDSDRAPRFMAGHNEWLRRGFEDGVFLASGKLQPDAGGAILAHGVSQEQLQLRVEADPFVAEGVVEAEILAIATGRVDPRLQFLLA